MKRIPLAVAVSVLAIVLALAGVFALRDGEQPAAGPPAPSGTGTVQQARALPDAKIPAHVLSTLAEIDAGRWPPKDNSGTKGGGPWQNREGRLPREHAGKAIRYQEWDVNVRKPGRTRDAERIVTGSDQSAWYTADHYSTFTRIR